MHMRGDPGTMQARENTTYEDVVIDVGRELSSLAEQALAAGVEPSCLVLDPGGPVHPLGPHAADP
jgi:dihydropteroate synthase